jgi:hypothetical protein
LYFRKKEGIICNRNSININLTEHSYMDVFVTELKTYRKLILLSHMYLFS